MKVVETGLGRRNPDRPNGKAWKQGKPRAAEARVKREAAAARWAAKK